MTRIEKTQKVSASAETLFNVLKDYEHYSRWNPSVQKSEKNGSEKSFILKTNSGDQIVYEGERVPYQKTSHLHNKHPYIKETGEMFRTCSNCKDTNVTFYAIPSNGEITDEIHNETEMKLKGLKHYAEFIQKGGNPEHYSKIQMI